MPRRKTALLSFGLRPSFGLWPQALGQARTEGEATVFKVNPLEPAEAAARRFGF